VPNVMKSLLEVAKNRPKIMHFLIFSFSDSRLSHCQNGRRTHRKRA